MYCISAVKIVKYVIYFCYSGADRYIRFRKTSFRRKIFSSPDLPPNFAISYPPKNRQLLKSFHCKKIVTVSSKRLQISSYTGKGNNSNE